MNTFGIEKLGIYPGQYVVDIADLAAARGLSIDEIRDEVLVIERAVFAPWEDTVTMAVNAADPILTEEDREAIGLLIVASETSIDQEKALSTWVHEALRLPSDCRNFEIKHACLGATDGIRMALAWLATAGRGRKALVATGDHSLLAFGEVWEPINGGVGAAMLLSDQPRALCYDGPSTLYTQNLTDVIRPTPRHEAGNSQESLYGYLEALHMTFSEYLERYPEARQYDEHFRANIYHTPYAGLSYLAHRSVLQILHDSVSQTQSRADFERRILPYLDYNRRIGSSYGASTFIALTCMLQRNADIKPGDRLSFFAYGAGSCGEFYSASLGSDPRAATHGKRLEKQLNERIRLNFEQYEACERGIDACIGARDIVPELDLPRKDERIYALKSIDDYVRTYEWRG